MLIKASLRLPSSQWRSDYLLFILCWYDGYYFNNGYFSEGQCLLPCSRSSRILSPFLFYEDSFADYHPPIFSSILLSFSIGTSTPDMHPSKFSIHLSTQQACTLPPEKPSPLAFVYLSQSINRWVPSRKYSSTGFIEIFHRLGYSKFFWPFWLCKLDLPIWSLKVGSFDLRAITQGLIALWCKNWSRWDFSLLFRRIRDGSFRENFQ